MVRLVLFERHHRYEEMTKSKMTIPLRFGLSDKSRKFVLLKDERDNPVMIIGPTYLWPVEYHHQELIKIAKQELEKAHKVLGGGSINQDSETINVLFWASFAGDTVESEFYGYDLQQELSAIFKIPVNICKLSMIGNRANNF